MRAELKRLQKDLGITTVFVTHDQLEAITMADRVAVMDLGVLQQHGTPHELFAEPANVFVAKFIGEPPMNLLPCELQDRADGAHLVGEGLDLKLPDALRQKAAEQATGGEVLLGARPQHMLIHREDQIEANGRNVFAGTVYITEPLGAEQLVRVRVGSEIVQILTSDDFEVGLDEEVLLEVESDRFFLFDQETEQRIG
jgi:ABC-type sugar transport system ATPase subunit